MGGRTPLTRGIKELVAAKTVKISIVEEEEAGDVKLATLKQGLLGSSEPFKMSLFLNSSYLNMKYFIPD